MRIVLTLLLAFLVGAVASWAKVHAQTVTPPAVQQDDPNLEAIKKAAILRAYQLVRIPPCRCRWRGRRTRTSWTSRRIST